MTNDLLYYPMNLKRGDSIKLNLGWYTAAIVEMIFDSREDVASAVHCKALRFDQELTDWMKYKESKQNETP